MSAYSQERTFGRRTKTAAPKNRRLMENLREEEYYATASRLLRRVMKPNPARPKATMARVAGSETATTGMRL